MHDIGGTLQQLYNAGLYSNVVELCNLANISKELYSDSGHQLQSLLADSLFELKEWKRAEAMYRQVLQGRKYCRSLQQNNGQQQSDVAAGAEVDVKYKIYQCYMNIGQSNKSAIEILQSIPAKHRPCKVNIALGKLYQSAGQDRLAVASYREVVREQPMAVEAVRSLLLLGVKPREVQELTMEAEGDTGGGGLGAEWLADWVAGLAKLYSKDYSGAVRDLARMEASPGVCVDMGLAHHWAGHTDQAILSLARAVSMSTLTMRGMDSLAALYAETGKVRELENLSVRLMNLSEEHPQPWVAMGYFCHLAKKSPKTVYFAHKACTLDPRNDEALLLKGRVLLDLKKLPDAINHFKEALNVAPYRYEAHKGLVDCYVGLSRHREAVNFATGCCKHLANSPRALTLYASVLLKDQLSQSRAKGLLEKAAVTGYLPAVYKLVELLDREGATHRAIDLIQQQLVHTSTSILHQKLADLYVRTGPGGEDKAVEHYTKALTLDPGNEAALVGLQKMETNTDGMEASGYDLSEMEDKYEAGSVGRPSPDR